MNTKQLHELILYDLTHSKDVKNVKAFKENLHKFSKEELKEVIESIDHNIYLGQHGVDDLTWIRLKKLIKIILEH